MDKGLPSSKIHPLSEYLRSAFCCQAPSWCWGHPCATWQARGAGAQGQCYNAWGAQKRNPS